MSINNVINSYKAIITNHLMTIEIEIKPEFCEIFTDFLPALFLTLNTWAYLL